MSKKIYIVSQLGVSNAGGVEKVSYYLYEILKEKYDIEIITRGKLNFGKLNNLIQPVLISLKLAFKKNCLVIGNSWHCFLYPADISIHHGTSAGIMKNTGEGGFSLKLTAWMEKISAKKAKKVLAVSQNCKNELIELYGIPESKIIVLNNFVQDEVFTPAEGGKTLNSEPAQNPNPALNTINVCFSGALLGKKGIDKLQAFSEYIEKGEISSKTGKKYCLTLNIATNYEKNAAIFAGKKNTSVRTGLKGPQMPDFYQANDIMFFPTKYEGFSMAALEALSCGLPLVGTKFAVSPELENFDFCKLITSETSESEIAEEIIMMYEKFANPSGRAEIHQKIKESFGTDQYKKRLLALIEEIII